MTRFISALARTQLAVAMLALTATGLVTVADVALKYLFNRPIVGAYDLVETLLPVVVFNGIPAMLLRRQTIAIDLIDHAVPPRVVRVLGAIGDLVVAVMLIMIALAFLTPARQAFEYGDRKIELGLPIVAIWAVVLAGMIGVMLAAGMNVRSALAQHGRSEAP
jgi:TRAP-type C4-dicarboxylate transport system permease small subunit